MDERKCPACGSRMIEGPESRGAWGCTSCGGVWAGRGLENQVASVLDPKVRELADVAALNVEQRLSRMPAPGKRPCPECRVQLTWRELAGVEVDVCSEHGTWFDRNELQRVADRRTGTKRESDNMKSAPPNNAGNEAAADVAIGAVALFFAIVTE